MKYTNEKNEKKRNTKYKIHRTMRKKDEEKELERKTETEVALPTDRPTDRSQPSHSTVTLRRPPAKFSLAFPLSDDAGDAPPPPPRTPHPIPSPAYPERASKTVRGAEHVQLISHSYTIVIFINNDKK